MKYWKTETDDNCIFHMYYGENIPNYYWEEYEPDIDTEKYYLKSAKTKKGYAIIEVNENDI